MKNFFERRELYKHLFGLLVLTAMIVVAMVIKEKDIAKPSGAQNLEATYHALLTIESLRQNEIRDHWLLPTVTLGLKNDAFISWGATVPTRAGDYIYTSFTPPGFLMPYVVFEAFDLTATVKNLSRFNMLIGAIVAVLLHLLIIRLILHLGASFYVATIGALVGVSVALFSREALLSTGIIYWPHSIYQLILVSSLHLLFNLLKYGLSHRGGILYSKGLLLLLFIGAWTEWTGYIFNLGLVFILWFQVGKPELRRLASKVLVVTAAAGIVTLLHFGFAVGFHESLNAFADRFLARNIQIGSIIELIGGYGLSYGAFLLVALVVVMRSYLFGTGIAISSQQSAVSNQQSAVSSQQSAVSSQQSAVSSQQSAIVHLVLLASIVPLVENFIMLQHATQFSFSRLKFVIPLAILLGLAFIDRSIWFRLFLIAGVALASVHGFRSHQSDMVRYSDWAHHHQANIALVERLREKVDFECATFASNLGVRGYANLLIGRSIYEYKTPNQAYSMNVKRGGCASVFLVGRWVFPDLQRYNLAIVSWPDGRKSVLTEGDVK